VFAVGSNIAVLGWLALLIALYWPRVRGAAIGLVGFAIPGLFAIAYALLMVQGWGQATGGGYGSIEAVRALFSNDAALTAGWLHYLAFDLLIGLSLVRASADFGILRLAVIPCLLLTFLFGPIGWLLFQGLRLLPVRGGAQ